jgi:hypothetical protein
VDGVLVKAEPAVAQFPEIGIKGSRGAGYLPQGAQLGGELEAVAYFRHPDLGWDRILRPEGTMYRQEKK